MAEQLYNSMVSYINQPGGLDDTATSVQLLDLALFPDLGNYRITIEKEICLVTAHAAGLLTLVRAQEGTVASAHSNLLPVFVVFTAGGFLQWGSEL